MQSLQSGMVLVGVEAPLQDVVVGSRPGGRRRNRHRLPEKDSHDDNRSRNGAAPLVEMRDMSVSFGGVHAVKDVTIDLQPGEILGLVGGNGAGKSTLIKTLSGAQKADSGEIFVDGEPVVINSPDRRQEVWVSRPSTRHWLSPTTSMPRATCSWDGS